MNARIVVSRPATNNSSIVGSEMFASASEMAVDQRDSSTEFQNDHIYSKNTTSAVMMLKFNK